MKNIYYGTEPLGSPSQPCSAHRRVIWPFNLVTLVTL